jgi:hypothetical protein
VTTLDTLVRLHESLNLSDIPVTSERLARALEIAHRFVDPHDRYRALLALADYLPAGERTATLTEARQIIDSIEASSHRSAALAALVDKLPPQEARQVIDSIDNTAYRSQALVALADKLPPQERAALLAHAGQFIETSPPEEQSKSAADDVRVIVPAELWQNPPDVSEAIELSYKTAFETGDKDIDIRFSDRTIQCQLERKHGRLSWNRAGGKGAGTLVFLGAHSASATVREWFDRLPPTPFMLLFLDILNRPEALARAEALTRLARVITADENIRHCVRSSLLATAEIHALSHAGSLEKFAEDNPTAAGEDCQASPHPETALANHDWFWGRFTMLCADKQGAYTYLDARTLLEREPATLQGFLKEVHLPAEVEVVPELLAISIREGVDVVPESRELWRAWLTANLGRNAALRDQMLALL